MQDINWVQIGIGFLGGGAIGAFIKQFFDNRRNRIQPIGYATQIRSVYDSGDNKLLDSQIFLTEDTVSYKFSKLYTGEVQIFNTGLHDYPQFTFGLTFPATKMFVQAIQYSSDRHHTVKIDNMPSLKNQINAFDVTLTPFNRKDYYTIQFLASTEDVSIEPESLTVSSPHPIRMVATGLTEPTVVLEHVAIGLFNQIINSFIGPVSSIKLKARSNVRQINRN